MECLHPRFWQCHCNEFLYIQIDTKKNHVQNIWSDWKFFGKGIFPYLFTIFLSLLSKIYNFQPLLKLEFLYNPRGKYVNKIVKKTHTSCGEDLTLKKYTLNETKSA